ncbi:MAG: shikimate dehydrogenase [Anaerolineae bacterium]
MRNINGSTNVVGILGWPVGHTLSPIMHNAAFAALNLNWIYVPLPIPPEQIKHAVQGLRAFNFAGANVTIPHKQAIMRYLDEIDPVAQSIGAVNTIAISNGKLRGYNTDGYGFLKSLTEVDFEPRGARCPVLGAGGAARAAVYSLADAGAAAIAVYNRTVERAAFLVDDLRSDFGDIRFSFEALSPGSLRAVNHTCDLVVNTTSLGMFPRPGATPWPPEVSLPRAVICDLVYNPLKTRFLQQAQAAGLKTVDGLGMLIHQGARAFQIWTGQAPPPDLMRQAVLAELGSRNQSVEMREM